MLMSKFVPYQKYWRNLVFIKFLRMYLILMFAFCGDPVKHISEELDDNKYSRWNKNEGFRLMGKQENMLRYFSPAQGHL